jgi:dihydroxyacetone kinase
MNYTGDVLHFGMATEQAKAAGTNAQFFAIGDDVAVGRAKGGKVGRRGIAGGILVLKLCGALAELGGSLSEVYSLAQHVTSNLVSVGASLECVHVPGRANPPETHSAGIEIGMGIHNEPGNQHIEATLPELVQMMIRQLLSPEDTDRHYVHITENDQVILLINNLGGVSMLELAGIVHEVCTQLKDFGLVLVRVISGTFLTSLNGMGFSISLLKLADTGLGDGKSLLELLDFPAEAVGWAAPIQRSTWDTGMTTKTQAVAPVTKTAKQIRESTLTWGPEFASKVLRAGLTQLIAAEEEVTRLDTIVGDGDCGIGLKRGAEAVLQILSSLPTDAVASVQNIASVVEKSMDGTSGAIYSIFLSSLAHSLRELDEGPAKQVVDSKHWSIALQSSLTALSKCTPAVPGDRTLMDALVPFIDTLSSSGDIKKAAKAARDGAERTKFMQASLGRAVYVCGEGQWVGKIPDPGAWGLQEFLNGLASEF